MEYWLLRNKEKYGPYSQEQLAEFAVRGDLSDSDRLWHQGLEGWQAPLSVLPSLELVGPDQPATGATNPEPTPGTQQQEELPAAGNEPPRRKASFLRTGLTWIPLFSALLVGALGFQSFLREAIGPDLTQLLSESGWFDPEEAEMMAGGGIDLFLGHLYEEDDAFKFMSWIAGLLVGTMNGLSFGAILGWLAGMIGPRGSLRNKIVLYSGLGGGIGLLLDSFLGESPLAFFVGFLGLKEGLLLGACFAAVHTLDELRAHAGEGRSLG